MKRYDRKGMDIEGSVPIRISPCISLGIADDDGFFCLRRLQKWELLTELTETGAYKLVDKFLGMTSRPTALYCFNNTLANLSIAEFKRRGLGVPKDVSVMGAGGEEVPDLTCHQVDWNQMGRTAVQILFRALAATERRDAEHHLCSHTMRLGKTTAGPIV